ncbi:hypothetical protein [Anaerovibrio lipolyticus]|uniref:hypothetical protein n=1 Tax=Anaerovibrio lipolyticus TaxID=82374 RepID=UPI0026F2041D|nr:hypothetical protein [Anaerovibrio lipolyticus]
MKETDNMRIFVDADGCPVVRQTEEVASKYDVPVTLLCDTNHILQSDYSEVKVIGASADGAIRLERQTIRDVESAADTAAGVRGEIESGRAGVRAASESNLQLKKENDRAGELIRDCQSILRMVRERGASQTE